MKHIIISVLASTLLWRQVNLFEWLTFIFYISC